MFSMYDLIILNYFYTWHCSDDEYTCHQDTEHCFGNSSSITCGSQSNTDRYHLRLQPKPVKFIFVLYVRA